VLLISGVALVVALLFFGHQQAGVLTPMATTVNATQPNTSIMPWVSGTAGPLIPLSVFLQQAPPGANVLNPPAGWTYNECFAPGPGCGWVRTQ
jgi:galactitol-specific phosphotransferase system IIC component